MSASTGPFKGMREPRTRTHKRWFYRQVGAFGTLDPDKKRLRLIQDPSPRDYGFRMGSCSCFESLKVLLFLFTLPLCGRLLCGHRNCLFPERLSSTLHNVQQPENPPRISTGSGMQVQTHPF